jgi:hypothetical protein
MSLLAMGLGLAFAGGMVQGTPEVLDGIVLGHARTTYDPAGLRHTRRNEARCADLQRDPDGAWPVPLTGLVDAPDGAAVIASAAGRADCYYLMRPGTGTLEAIPLDIPVPASGYALPGEDTTGLGRRLARAVASDGGRFRAEADVQAVVVGPAGGPSPDCAAAASGPAATLTLLGSGVPTREPPLGLPAAPERPALDRPGALFAVSVRIDRHGRPVPGCTPRAWPLWSNLLGELHPDGLSLPGARLQYDDRVSATLDRLGFAGVDPDDRQAAHPTASLDGERLGNPERLAPVLPVGITDLQWLDFDEAALQATPAQVAHAADPVGHAVLLVAPGRTDHLTWTLGDRAGWPLLSALHAPQVGIGDLRSPADEWGAVLQQTASHVDQLRPVVQADAVLPPAGDRTTVHVSAAGAMDPQVFIDAFEREWPKHQPIKGVPWDAGRSGVAARIERTVGTFIGKEGADMKGVYLPPGVMPALPVVPLAGQDAWVQRWRLAAHGAALGDEHLWIGLGDPVADPDWHAVLLRLDPAVLDPSLGPAEARAAARASTVRFSQHWRLFEPVLVRWTEKQTCDEPDGGAPGEAAALDGLTASAPAAEAPECVEAQVVRGRHVAFWQDDFLRFLYRYRPGSAAREGGRAGGDATWCEDDPVDGITAIACTVERLGELEWSSPAIRKGTVEQHAQRYARRVRTWLRYQRARRHALLTHRASNEHANQARRGVAERPAWTQRSVDAVLEPQVGALLRGPGATPPVDGGAPGPTPAAQTRSLIVPPAADPGIGALPWPASLELRPKRDGGFDVESPLGGSQLVAVDHRVRRRGERVYLTAWCLLTGPVLDAAGDDARTLKRRRGDLAVRTWEVVVEGGAPTGLRELQPPGQSDPVIVETSDGMDAFIDFDAERFRKRTKLLTARSWESRWLYRADDPRIFGTSALTAESKQSLDVQRLLMDQMRWPASTRGLDMASSLEIIDQDNVLVVALGGRPYDLTALGVPVPISFVEIPLPTDVAFRDVPPPPPIVMQSRLPWLYTPSMVPSEAGWLTRPIKGTLRCKDPPASHRGPTGIGTAELGAEPCFFRIGDMQYEPDSRALLLSAAESPLVGEWRTYLATMDQSWFSPLATLHAPAGAPAGTRPALARSFDADGHPLLGLQRAATGETPTHADFHWLRAEALAGGGERQRVAPCLDPSDTRCNLR